MKLFLTGLAISAALGAVAPPSPAQGVAHGPARGPRSARPKPCARPPIPAGGLPLQHQYDNLLTLSDGYVTLGDMTLPATAPPYCGWPLVVLVHGLPGSRINQRPVADEIAGNGYAVWAYEVRGQAQAVPLNPPGMGFAWYGPNIKFDLAEQIYYARANWSDSVQRDAVAVVGSSQGGIHAWIAAAYSGKPVTVPGRGTIAFPRIACVSSFNFNTDSHEHSLRDLNLFEHGLIKTVFTPSTSTLAKDPSYVANVQSAFLAQDPLALETTWKAEQDRLWGDMMSASTVPVLWAHSYLDDIEAPQPGLNRVLQMPATTPTRVVLSTGDHNSPSNTWEDWFRRDLRLRWLERFLWDVPNGVELEAGINQAPLPLDPALRNDPSYVWGQRYDAQKVTPADVKYTRRFLGADGGLYPSLPVPGPPLPIVNSVAPGFDAQAWSQDPTIKVAQVKQSIPLSEQVYSMAPLDQETELAGRPHVSLCLDTNNPHYQVAAILQATPPGGTAVQLAAWGQGVLDGVPGQNKRVSIVLPNVSTVLPAGTVLSLRIRNYWLVTAPLAEAFVTVPYFESSTVRIQHGPGNAWSYIDLPVRSEVRAALKSTLQVMSSGSPQAMTLDVVGGQARAGQDYEIRLGTSGQVPGTVLGSTLLPMTSDDVTTLFEGILNAGSPFAVGFSGTLDASGQATATLDWSGLPALLSAVSGRRVTFAAWITNPADGSIAVANPHDLIVQ